MKITKPKKDDEQTIQDVDFPVVEPHAFFAWFYHNRRPHFVKQFLGGDETGGALKSFWSEVIARKDPRLEGHDFKSRPPNWQLKAVPGSLHGDAVPCVQVGKPNTKSYDCYSMQGTLGKGPTLEQKHYIMGFFSLSEVHEDELEPGAGGTMHATFTHLLWSFWFLYLGIWPTVQPDGAPWPEGSVEANKAGTPLADGYFFVLWGIKADLDHLAKAFGLSHYGSNKPCCLCPCEAGKNVDPGMSYTNFGSSSKWTHMFYTHTVWKNMNPNPFYLFQLPFMSVLNVEPDELHVVHLGTSMYFLGSVLWMLCYLMMPDSPSQNMKSLWLLIVQQYRTMHVKCQFGNLTLSSFTDPDRPGKHYPKLKGKGAEVKDLMLPMLHIWQAQHNARDNSHALVFSALQHMCSLQKNLHDHATEALLPRQVAHDFQNSVVAFLSDYVRFLIINKNHQEHQIYKNQSKISQKTIKKLMVF